MHIKRESQNAQDQCQNSDLALAHVSFRLLEPYVVLDGYYALDAAGNFNCSGNVSSGMYEAAQLNHAFERLDVDFRNLQVGIFENSRFHLGGDDAVIDVFAGSCMLG